MKERTGITSFPSFNATTHNGFRLGFADKLSFNFGFTKPPSDEYFAIFVIRPRSTESTRKRPARIEVDLFITSRSLRVAA